MRKVFIAILLLAFSTNSHPQNPSKLIDSLKQLIAAEKQDTSRAQLLLQLSKNYLESKPDTALLMAQQGLHLSKKSKFAKGEALSLKAMGAVYGVTGNYPKGLETLLQALQINESINDQRGMMLCYVTIGANYSHQKDYKQSLYYFFKARPIAETIHDDRYLMITLLNIGDTYEKLNQLDSAGFYTQLVYHQADHLNNLFIRGIALNNLGNINAKMGMDDIALAYYRHSLPDLTTENNNDALCEATFGMANLFKKANHTDSAMIYARQSLLVAAQSGFTQRLLDASNFLSDLYERKKMVDSAYKYQKISIAAKDSLFSQDKVKELQNLGFTEHIRQQEITEAVAAAAELRKKNIQMVAIGAFIPAFFGIVLLFSRRKTKSRTIEFMGILALLLFFEFITLIIEPYIAEWTHHTPIFMLLALVIVASILVPLHHKLEHKVKEKLAHKKSEK